MENPLLKLNVCPLPKELASSIVLDLRRREKNKGKKRAFLFGFVALLTFTGLIFAIENVVSAAVRSGFAGYASLVFSDWSTVVSIWKAFALSLAETAPLFAGAICATILFIFLWSLGQTVRYSKAIKLGLN